jgi:hypothetical protein
MSEEPTKVVKTVATVSVRPAATPKEADTEHLARMAVHCERTAETLREIANWSTSAKESLARIDVSQPPRANDTMVAQALAKIDKVISMANAAGKANDIIMGSGKGKDV